MAERKYNIKKTYLNKDNYTKVIDNRFTQLAPPTPEPVVAPTVDNFFQLYNDLFFDIPKEGEINSHQFLINQSTEYTQGEITSEEVEALIAEIDNLREQLLEANEQILELTKKQIPDIPEIDTDDIFKSATTTPPGGLSTGGGSSMGGGAVSGGGGGGGGGGY